MKRRKKTIKLKLIADSRSVRIWNRSNHKIELETNLGAPVEAPPDSTIIVSFR